MRISPIKVPTVKNVSFGKLYATSDTIKTLKETVKMIGGQAQSTIDKVINNINDKTGDDVLILKGDFVCLGEDSYWNYFTVSQNGRELNKVGYKLDSVPKQGSSSDGEFNKIIEFYSPTVCVNQTINLHEGFTVFEDLDKYIPGELVPVEAGSIND